MRKKQLQPNENLLIQVGPDDRAEVIKPGILHPEWPKTTLGPLNMRPMQVALEESKQGDDAMDPSTDQ